MLTRLVLVGLLASTLVFAQRGGGGGGSKGGGGGGVPNIGFGPTNRLDRLTEALKLSKDQKKDIKNAMDEAQKEATPIHELMNKNRLAVAEAIAAGKGKDELDKAILSEAEQQTQMTSLELRTLVKMVAVLELEQKQKGGNNMLLAMVTGGFLGKNWNTD